MVLRSLCKAKIHRAVVTGADVDYIGSIAIDEDLMDRVDIRTWERVAVWDVNNGERFETYALPAPRGSGEIIVNGAAARRVQRGDHVIIVAFAITDEMIVPRMILVNGRNEFTGWLTDNRMPGPEEQENYLAAMV